MSNCIANELLKNGKTVLYQTAPILLENVINYKMSKQKDSLDNIYKSILDSDLLIIDDLGTERVSSWALEKLYTIIENRNENKLPIIVTTRFNKESLLDRFYQSEDEELSEAVIQKLYQFCYGIELKKYDQNEKEKVSISDQTKY